MGNYKLQMVDGLRTIRQFVMLMILLINIRLGTTGWTPPLIKISELDGQLIVLVIHTLKSLLSIYWEWSFRALKE